MRKVLFPVLAALSFAGGAVPATAAEVTIRIDLEGLDPADPGDSVAILERIDSTVTSACRRAGSSWFVSANATADCVEDATEKALDKLEELRSPAMAGGI